MKKNLSVLAGLLLIAALSGCASWGDFWASHGGILEYKYSPRIGVSTYDDVLKNMSDEEKWEMPTSEEASRTRGILLVTYSGLTQKNVTKTTYHGGFLEEDTSESVSDSKPVGRIYQFVFDGKTKVLKWFKYHYYPEDGYEDGCEVGDNSYAPRAGEKFTEINSGKTGVTTAAGTLEQKLKELQALKDKKVITPEEYKKMREKAINDFK